MIRLSSIFSDKMVFQRDTDENTVWGYGEGEIIIKLTGTDDEGNDRDYETSVNSREDGYFEGSLPSLPAGGNYTLTIIDSTDKVYINDIIYGDVFVCGGQSNMELPLNRTMER